MYKKERTGHKGNLLIDEEQLLAYIDGTMPPAEQHMLEEILEENPFLNDAVEGLAEIHDKEQLKAIATQINHQLRRQVKSRRQGRRRRHRAKLTDHWGWIFVVIILLLALTAWWVIRMVARQG